MARYIDADKLTFSRVRIIHSDGTIGGWHAVVMSSVIKDAPAADVVSRGVFDQIKWERDNAMQQLEEHGIPFGGKADVVEVRHGEWKDNHCTLCGMTPIGEELWKHLNIDPPRFEFCMPFCPTCGARMDSERKEL